MDAPRQEPPQEQLTRLTTEAEQANIAGIELDQTTVGYFMDQVAKGLTTAASAHSAAVQEDIGLSAEVTVRLSRPARGPEGEIVEVVGRETVTGKIQARKVFKDPDNKPA